MYRVYTAFHSSCSRIPAPTFFLRPQLSIFSRLPIQNRHRNNSIRCFSLYLASSEILYLVSALPWPVFWIFLLCWCRVSTSRARQKKLDSEMRSNAAGESRGRVACIGDDRNGVEEYSTVNSQELCVVNLDRFSRLMEEDVVTPDSKYFVADIKLPLNHLPKAFVCIGENKKNGISFSSPPTPTSHGCSMMETTAPATTGSPKIHHQITITAPGEVKRFSLRRFPHRFSIGPRRILLLFAVVSCMGTSFLIYLSLCASKFKRNDDVFG